MDPKLNRLPGAEFIRQGLEDLGQRRETLASLLVSIGAPRLRFNGIDIPPTFPGPELRLYQMLARESGDDAHSRYNALIRRLVSFESALECEAVGAARVGEFMRRFGLALREETRVYLVGGASAVLVGWRETTAAVDIKMVPDRDDAYRALPELKEALQINVELANPDDFIPPLPGWESRSPFVAREGRVNWHHYDFHAQALAKIERGHDADLNDVREMFARKLVEAASLRDLFEAIRPALYRYPALDPASFARKVESAISPPPPSRDRPQ